MFRTIYATQADEINTKDNWLILRKEGQENKVPLADIQTLVFDNPLSTVSLYTLNTLAEMGVNVIICDNKHMPSCSVLSFTQHYRPYGVLKKQLALTEEFKDLLWQKIVRAKIENQAMALSFVGESSTVVLRLRELAAETFPGDKGNREGIAAKLYFRNFYGFDFTRFSDDVINKAMNYGYAILRSIIARSLCAYGYNCSLGIHHINEANAFNLADDFMEPLRPLVDLWVNKNRDALVDELSRTNKRELINIVNVIVDMSGKKMKMYNAVDRYISSFTTSVNSNDSRKLQCPRLC